MPWDHLSRRRPFSAAMATLLVGATASGGVLVGAASAAEGPTPSAVGSAASPSPSPTPFPTMPPLDPAALDCPVTVPGPSPEEFSEQLFGSSHAFGNDELWVGALPTIGVYFIEPEWLNPDGSLGIKLGWWRITPGTLTITARRLDGPAPPIRSHVPEGYGTVGFQASGVDFPTEGCWEVTGAVGDATLTFVMFVQRA